jgi:hypothetical protein
MAPINETRPRGDAGRAQTSRKSNAPIFSPLSVKTQASICRRAHLRLVPPCPAPILTVQIHSSRARAPHGISRFFRLRESDLNALLDYANRLEVRR